MAKASLHARKITQDELAQTDQLFRIAFEFPDPQAKENGAILSEMAHHPDRRENRYALEKWAAFDELGNMAACIGGMRYTVHFDGHQLPMSGIGGVSSLPQYRRQGGIRLCFEQALRSNYDDGVVLSYLYPFSTQFYGKFGYEPCGRTANYAIPLRAIAPEPIEGTVKAHHMGSLKQDIMQVYADYTKHLNLACVRDERLDWDFLEQSDMSKSGQYLYVWYNKDGIAKGVIGFQKVKNPVEKFDMDATRIFWFRDDEGLRGLLQFARGFETYYRNLKIKLTPSFPITAFVREWGIYPYGCELYMMGMARIVNVEKALLCAAYRGGGGLVLAVKDEMLPENNRSFAVHFADGRAVSVEPTEQTPDVSLPIGILSKFLLGDGTAAQLQYYPGVEIFCDPARLKQIFYPKEMLILDSF